MTYNEKWTEERKQLEREYFKRYHLYADCYDDIEYEGMSYDEYMGYLRTCLNDGISMEELMDRIDREHGIYLVERCTGFGVSFNYRNTLGTGQIR